MGVLLLQLLQAGVGTACSPCGAANSLSFKCTREPMDLANPWCIIPSTIRFRLLNLAENLPANIAPVWPGVCEMSDPEL